MISHAPADDSQKLIEQVKASLPLLPDDTVSILVQQHGLTEKDAKTIMSFDDGDRLEYFYETLASLEELSPSDADPKVAGTLVGNLYVAFLCCTLSQSLHRQCST